MSLLLKETVKTFSFKYFICLLFTTVESVELSNIDNNSDSGISPNDSEVEVLLYDRKLQKKKGNLNPNHR